MKKPGRLLATTVTLPFLTGCFALQPTPLPSPLEREGTEIRGVILRGDNGAEDERVEFAEVNQVEWRDAGVMIVGSLSRGGDGAPMTREFLYEDLSGILTRTFDPNRTSILIGAVMVGGLAIAAIIINGRGDKGPTVIEGS